MRVVFVCSGNLLRSPTAASIFNGWIDRHGRMWLAFSAGADFLNASDAPLFTGADAIIVMEEGHAEKVRALFTDLPPIRCLGIPDRYERNDMPLVNLLKRRVPPVLNSITNRPEEKPKSGRGYK